MVAVYVDYYLVVGSKNRIKDMITYLLQNPQFGFKVGDTFSDYLTCKIRINQETRTSLLTKSHLINSSEGNFIFQQ